MRSLLSPRPSTSIALHSAVAQEESAASPPDVDPPTVGWPVAAVAGGLFAAAVGWLLTAGLAVLGWLAAEPGTLGQAVEVGTRFWLVANGVGTRLGTVPVTLVPWGATTIFAVVLARCASLAARQARPPTGQAAVGVAGLATLSYLAPVVCVALLAGRPVLLGPGALGVPVLLTAAAAWGSCRSVSYSPSSSWPPWCRGLPRAVLAGQLVLLAGGAVALTGSLMQQLDRVVALTAALDPGIAGGITMLFAQLAYAPTGVCWAAAYTLGAGFSVGGGSFVSPVATQVGMLPGLPLLAALPSQGDPRNVGWLAVGIAAGMLVAWLALAGRQHLRFDGAAVVGASAAVLAGLVFVVLAWWCCGDLGARLLAGAGPRLLPLLVMTTATLGLSGLLTGAVLGLVRRRRA